MMYTRERLLKAVRDAGRGGRPFTLGEVRGELGLKSRDKREQKRFRAEGHAVSTLISYGEAWYRWYMRRLAERPANVWFVVKSLVS